MDIEQGEDLGTLLGKAGENTMKLRGEYTCPLELTHDVTKGKWKPIVLWQLGKDGATQPSDLEKKIAGIGQKMLLEQLAELIEVGMVEKRVYSGYPLKTEYRLTQRGRRMLEAICIMQEIGTDMMRENAVEDALGFIGLQQPH